MPQRPTIERCTVDYKNDELPPIEHAKVTFLGDRCTLWQWDAQGGRHRQADSLSKITTSTERGSNVMTIQGTSSLFAQEIGVDATDAQVTVMVTPTPAVVPA